LRAFEKKMLRRIFGFKKQEVTRTLTKLYSDELHNLDGSKNIIRGKMKKHAWER
jgi:hypothetical protein